MKAAKGHVFKYGDNVDTDVIIPEQSGSSAVAVFCDVFFSYPELLPQQRKAFCSDARYLFPVCGL